MIRSKHFKSEKNLQSDLVIVFFSVFHVLALLPLFILAPRAVYALDMEYYTYNGFDASVGAFRKVALIFSDGAYMGLFVTVISMGILFGVASVYARAATGAKAGIFSWALPVLLGVMIYHAFIIPRGTLHIYDPVKNQYQPVGGVPDGLVLLAGTLNLVERGLVDMVSASADPVGFQQQAGGIGFDMLLNMSAGGIVLSDQYLHKSLQKYIKSCVFFELERPGSTLTINQLANNSDFLPLFDQAASPALFTTYYEDTLSRRRGESMSCEQAFTLIRTKITNPTQLENATRARCADVGFDPTIPSEYNQCRAMFGNLVTWLEGASFSVTQVFRQTVIAQELSNVILSSSRDNAIKVLASRNAGTAMTASGITANEWIPIARAASTAFVIGFVPFLSIFIPTPILGRAIGLQVGFFVWLTAWGVTDAILHQFALDASLKAFEEVRQHQLGLTAISNFGTSSLKSLAAFSAVRWKGLMLATVISYGLFKFGGHALAMFAGGSMAIPQSTGPKAGTDTVTPEGQAQNQNALEAAPPVMDNAHKFDFSQRISARSNQMARNVGSGGGLGNQELAFETGMTESQGAVGASKGMQDVGNASGMGVAGASRAQTTMFKGSGVAGFQSASQTGTQPFGVLQAMKNKEYAQGFAQSQEFRGFADQHFKQDGMNNVQAMATAEQFAQKIGLGQRFGDLEGYEQAFQGAQQKGFKGDIKDFANFQSGMRNTRLFSEASVQQQVADQYFQGDSSSMFTAMSTYHNEQSAALLEKMGTHGFDPSSAAQYRGHIEALAKIGEAQAHNALGDSGLVASGRGKTMNEASKFQVREQMATALGFMQHQNDMEGYVAYLQQSHGQDTVTLNEGMAQNLSRHMHNAGYENFQAQTGDQAGFALDPSTGMISMAHSTAGGKSEAYDLSTQSSGLRETQEDVSTQRFSRGPEISPATMQSAALAKDGSLGKRISSAPTVAAREQEETAQAGALARSLSEKVSKTGKIMSFSEVGGKGQLNLSNPGKAVTDGLFGIKAGASAAVGLGRRNVEEQNFDLYYGTIRRLQSSAMEQATTSGEVNEEQFSNLYSESLYQLTRGTDELAQGKTEFSFGASSGIGETFEEAKEFMNKIKEKN